MFFSQWFNPFAWLQRSAVKNNLEYLTDQKISTPVNMQQYQLAMVSLAGKREVAPFLNNLSGNNLKTRIIMMKKKTENRNTLVRQLAVLPLLAVLIPGLSSKEYKVLPSESLNPAINEVIMDKLQESSSDTLVNKKKEVVVIGYALQKDSVRKYNSAAKKDSVVMISFRSPLDHKTVKSASESKINTKNKEVTVVGYKSPVDGKIQRVDTLRIRTTGQPGSDPLYILDGKEIKSIEGVEPDKIESISVLKDKSATTVYGEKGKNGVILITSKKSVTPADNVLIILDGKETSKKVADINPEEIQSVNVLKGDHAQAQYGEKGKNGVIEITLKKSAENLSAAVTTMDQLRKSIARSIRYPEKAMKNGEQGAIKVYAYVNGEGEITQISESAPGNGYLSVEEVVVVGYARENNPKKSVENSPALMQEAALTVKKLPALDIADFKGKWVVFNFKFMLQ
jgi:TonB-dependent SusC/RagA subfamily outer membrane receptor